MRKRLVFIRRVSENRRLQHGLFISLMITYYSYSNRSLCYIQLHDFTKAEIDATKSIHCDPLFVKAWLRRGICRISRKQMQLAYFDLLRVILSQYELIYRLTNSIQIIRIFRSNLPSVRRIRMSSKYPQQNILKSCLEPANYALRKASFFPHLYIGNTNEGISYMPDIYQLRPTDIPILERLATLVSTYHFWKEASY